MSTGDPEAYLLPKKPQPKAPLETNTESLPRWVELEHQRSFIWKPEVHERFLFTEQYIAETAPTELCTDPGFQDHFLHYSHLFSENPHPNVLRLEKFGSKNGKFFRLWRRRPLRNIIGYTAPTSKDMARAIHGSLEGLLHLLELGICFETNALYRLISLDEQGPFVARLPLTKDVPIKSPAGYYQQILAWTQPPEAEVFEPLLETSSEVQFRVGCLVWLLLAEIPAYENLGSRLTRPKRRDYDFGPALNRILLQMTELDSSRRFATLGQAFRELRDALGKSF